MSSIWIAIVILVLVVAIVLYAIARTMVPSKPVNGWEKQFEYSENNSSSSSGRRRPAEWQ